MSADFSAALRSRTLTQLQASFYPERIHRNENAQTRIKLCGPQGCSTAQNSLTRILLTNPIPWPLPLPYPRPFVLVSWTTPWGGVSGHRAETDCSQLNMALFFNSITELDFSVCCFLNFILNAAKDFTCLNVNVMSGLIFSTQESAMILKTQSNIMTSGL